MYSATETFESVWACTVALVVICTRNLPLSLELGERVIIISYWGGSQISLEGLGLREKLVLFEILRRVVVADEA
jgi:hypothetical protein